MTGWECWNRSGAFRVTVGLLCALLLAGCGTTDQQEADARRWYNAVYAILKPADESMATYKPLFEDLSAGKATVTQVYSALETMRDVQLNASVGIKEPLIPTSLKAEHQESLKQAVAQLQSALAGRSVAISSVLKYLNDPQPEYLADAMSTLELANTTTVKAMTTIANVLKAHGIHIKATSIG
jgi:hypothetical protein